MDAMDERRVDFDAQCYSYLLDALDAKGDAISRISEVQKSLVQIWFYRDSHLLTEMAVGEYKRIRLAPTG